MLLLGDSHRSRVNNGEGERSGRQSAEEANKLFSCAAAKNNDGFYKVPSFLLLLLRAVREITKQSGERGGGPLLPGLLIELGMGTPLDPK